MALSGDLTVLRDGILADLTSAYNYYTDTKAAWRLVRNAVASGRVFTIRNMTTNTVTTQADLAVKSRGYVTGQLAEATFQQFISIFEYFCFDLLRLWLTAYPQSLGRKTVNFQVALDSPDKEAVTELVVKKEVNEVLYGRPAEWFAYLEARAKLGCPSADEIERFTEAKASRDVLVHHRGIADKAYEFKAGKLARQTDGNKLDIPEHYHRETWELVRKLVTDISDAVIAKVP